VSLSKPRASRPEAKRATGAAGLALFVLLACPEVARAAAGQGTVQGVVIPPAKVEPPASQRLGFLERIENPIVELRQYDPFPECFIYLEGGPAAADAGTPPKSAVAWQLEANSFDPPLLAVVVGSTVEIDNDKNGETQLLVAPAQPALLSKDPIGPGGTKTVTASSDAIVIESRSSPHIKGRLIALPTRYFSKLDHNGRFKIEGVPAGRWTIKLWYRDGWANLPGRTVEVPGKDVKIDLPSDALVPASAAK
jgi:hypothetical protein